MALTLAQVDTMIDAALAAFEVEQTSYEFRGRKVEFRSLRPLQQHIGWVDARRKGAAGKKR